MLVTVVKGRSGKIGKFWYREGWVIRRAKRKLKDGKVVIQVGKKVLNRCFDDPSFCISFCTKNLGIPNYRVIISEDAQKEIKEKEERALARLLREQEIKKLTDQFLPPAPDLESLALIFPSVLETELSLALQKIKRSDYIHRREVGAILYKLKKIDKFK